MDPLPRHSNCLSSLCPLPPLKHLLRETDAPKRLSAVRVTSIRGLMGYGPPNWSFFLPLRILFGGLRTKIAELKPSLHQLTSPSHQLRSAYYPSGQAQLLVCPSIPHWKMTRFDYWDGICALICKHAVSKPAILTGLRWCLEKWVRQKLNHKPPPIVPSQPDSSPCLLIIFILMFSTHLLNALFFILYCPDTQAHRQPNTHTHTHGFSRPLSLPHLHLFQIHLQKTF